MFKSRASKGVVRGLRNDPNQYPIFVDNRISVAVVNSIYIASVVLFEVTQLMHLRSCSGLTEQGLAQSIIATRAISKLRHGETTVVYVRRTILPDSNIFIMSINTFFSSESEIMVAVDRSLSKDAAIIE
jgi:hypothetical protein